MTGVHPVRGQQAAHDCGHHLVVAARMLSGEVQQHCGSCNVGQLRPRRRCQRNTQPEGGFSTSAAVPSLRVKPGSCRSCLVERHMQPRMIGASKRAASRRSSGLPRSSGCWTTSFQKRSLLAKGARPMKASCASVGEDLVAHLLAVGDCARYKLLALIKHHTQPMHLQQAALGFLLVLRAARPRGVIGVEYAVPGTTALV
eukprot:scaffold6678_cov336-Prasinococcus_capsulatus_cf.AAC.8